MLDFEKLRNLGAGIDDSLEAEDTYDWSLENMMHSLFYRLIEERCGVFLRTAISSKSLQKFMSVNVKLIV